MSITHVATCLTDQNITVYMDGAQHIMSRSSPSFPLLLSALREERYEDALALLKPTPRLDTYIKPPAVADGEFAVRDGLVYLGGEPFSEEVSRKVIAMEAVGLGAEPLRAFLRKVRRNPSASAQRELLLFCIANSFMIHTSGAVVAYKRVRDNYTDGHSGTINNRVGQVVSMPRHQVDDRRDHTCSFGLHFAALQYARDTSGFNGPIMVILVDPEDVVSIPEDYSNQKGRCCRYEVIGELRDSTVGSAPGLPRQEVYSDRDIASSTKQGENPGLTAAKDAVLAEYGAVTVKSCHALEADLCEDGVRDFIADADLRWSTFEDEGYEVATLLESAVTGTQVDQIRRAAVVAYRDAEANTAEDEEEEEEEDSDDDYEEEEDNEDEDRDDELDEEDEDDGGLDETCVAKPTFPESLITALRTHLAAGQITSKASFANAVHLFGCNIEHPRVIDALKQAGLGAWLEP